jgi:hypothetical protein
VIHDAEGKPQAMRYPMPIHEIAATMQFIGGEKAVEVLWVF